MNRRNICTSIIAAAAIVSATPATISPSTDSTLNAAPKATSGDNAQWVDPMIGTGVSHAPTLWGNYGGTYPGAVSPWGMVQISPETSDRPSESGYYYSDNAILRITCLQHPSGYPNGSAGSLAMTFLQGTHNIMPHNHKGRRFSHDAEEAVPGYYRVRLADGDAIETAATAHAGMIRYATASSTTTLVVYKAGRISIVSPTEVHGTASHSIITFSRPMASHTLRGDTLFAHFATTKPLNITLTVSASGYEQSRSNGNAELCGGDFDSVRRHTYARWQKELACVELNGADDTLRRMFYTALYHAMLQPCNIADVGKKPHYAGYSPWDTFRTLHPLLTLLKPNVQADIADDMMSTYHRTGSLPNGPMTGFHAIPILLDSYAKGIARQPATEILDACRKSYGKFMRTDAMRQYLRQGYVGARHEQSVSITAELAYDDWAMMRLCRYADNDSLAAIYAARATNYSHLWDAQTLFMLPHDAGTPLRHAGELGYQESNRWTASLFAPHDMTNLVNLSGGNENFCRRLEYAFDAGHAVFDNETVMHYPWLYVWGRRPDLAIRRVRSIISMCYADNPGGIPGNDDLGSMSSWLAFAVMGIMPVCPGTDQYVVIPPMAREVVIHLEGGKTMRIACDAATDDGAMPQPLLNGKAIRRCHVTHDELARGGSLTFDARSHLDLATMQLPYSLTTGTPRFAVRIGGKQAKHTLPNAECAMPIVVSNDGADGVCVAVLTCGADTVASKNIFVPRGACLADTLTYRLYAEGKHVLRLGSGSIAVTVAPKPKNAPALCCTAMHVKPVVKEGEPTTITLTIKNIGSAEHSSMVAVNDGERLLDTLHTLLQPGAQRSYTLTLPHIGGNGIHTLRTLNASAKIKVYADATDATVLHADYTGGAATDKSGFGNDGVCHGALTWQGGTIGTASGAYIEFPTSESLMFPYQQFTMLTWVRPSRDNDKGYIDFFTKGDYTAMKMQGGDTLGFFAGGWGRGECGVPVPDNWADNWHLVAGVCSGDSIKVYIDGNLRQSVPVKGSIAASEMPWNLGRNAEMPFSRFGIMTFWGTRIYAASLNAEQISYIYASERDKIQQ